MSNSYYEGNLHWTDTVAVVDTSKVLPHHSTKADSCREHSCASVVASMTASIPRIFLAKRRCPPRSRLALSTDSETMPGQGHMGVSRNRCHFIYRPKYYNPYKMYTKTGSLVFRGPHMTVCRSKLWLVRSASLDSLSSLTVSGFARFSFRAWGVPSPIPLN